MRMLGRFCALPLTLSVAGIAERDQVAERVGFTVARPTELAKRDDVVDVERTPIWATAAIGADGISLSRLSARLRPRRSVVRLVATAPVRMVFATWRMFKKPVAPASLRAKASAVRSGRELKLHVARLAHCGLPSRFPLLDVRDVGSASANARAIGAWPAFVELKARFAFRTRLADLAWKCCLVAGTRAVGRLLRDAACECLVASRTCFSDPVTGVVSAVLHSLILLGFSADMEGVKHA
jgi:hypothetical protein